MNMLDEKRSLGLLTLLAGLVFAASPLGEDLGTDVLRAVAGLALFHRFAGPWGGPLEPASHRRWELAGGILLVAQLALGSGWLGALGLTACAWSWLRRRRPSEARARAARFLPLLLLCQPWVAHETTALGWWFRLSGAWVTEQAFGALGLAVAREGTLLTVEGSPISVEAACSGLQTLPAILLAGALLLGLRARTRAGYLLGLLTLPFLAWTANTVRIGVLSALALTLGQRAPTGAAHEWIGLAVVAGVVALAAAVPAVGRSWTKWERAGGLASGGIVVRSAAAAVALCTLAPVAIHWLHAPLERHSWLIFGVWFAPLLRVPSPDAPEETGWRNGLAGLALALAGVGLLLGVHGLAVLGVPLAGGALLAGRWRLLPWMIAALAWMPVAGWALQALWPPLSLALRSLVAGVGVVAAFRSAEREGRVG